MPAPAGTPAGPQQRQPATQQPSALWASKPAPTLRLPPTPFCLTAPAPPPPRALWRPPPDLPQPASQPASERATALPALHPPCASPPTPRCLHDTRVPTPRPPPRTSAGCADDRRLAVPHALQCSTVSPASGGWRGVLCCGCPVLCLLCCAVRCSGHLACPAGPAPPPRSAGCSCATWQGLAGLHRPSCWPAPPLPRAPAPPPPGSISRIGLTWRPPLTLLLLTCPSPPPAGLAASC